MPSPPISVLVVEDDPDVADVLVAFLEDIYAVDYAADVLSALAFLDCHRPAVVLLDCHLPGGRAAEVCAKAYALGSAVVAVSGSPDMPEDLAAFECQLFRKPFAQNELLAKMAAAIPH